MEKNSKNNQPKNLNLEPLSIAKFFYEKGIKNDIAIIHKLIYLTYLKVLREENALLFEEEWQAWSGGPILESISQQMWEHFDKYGNCQKLFAKVKPVEQKNILPYLETMYQRYKNYAKEEDQYLLFEETQTRPWKLARRNLTSNSESRKIELEDIISFAKQGASQI